MTSEATILSRLSHVVAAVTLASLPLAAVAGFQTGRITGYIPYSDGDRQVFIISLDTGQVDGCNVTARYAIDSGSPRFKNTMAAAMMAFHSQTPVTVSYNTTCAAWSNSHDLSYVCVGALPC